MKFLIFLTCYFLMVVFAFIWGMLNYLAFGNFLTNYQFLIHLTGLVVIGGFFITLKITLSRLFDKLEEISNKLDSQ